MSRDPPNTPVADSGAYQVGDLCVDMGRCRVTRQEEVIPLTRLSFDLLVALIKAAPNILTPDLMMERVWPGMVVSPETVTQRVKVLRDALGDDPRSPRYIEGVRGRGYRLTTTAIPVAPAAVDASPAVLRAGRQIWFWPAVMAAAIAVVALLTYLIHESRSDRRVVVERKAVTVSAAPSNSIAVLPFVDMSENKDQDYFSDGLTEEMIELLGQVPGLRVPARTSSFYFKGKSEDVETIARKLRVAHLLEGSVRKAGTRLHIFAQLISTDTGYHLWSQTYDRDDIDIFTIQDDIAKAVVRALQVELTTGARVTAARGTTNTEAYNQYLRGRQLSRRGSLESSRRSVEAYRKAVALDPNYAAAYAGLAIAEVWVADFTGNTTDGLARAGHDVDRAIALSPADVNGYVARCYLRTDWLWDWPGAQADIEKALSLDPHGTDVQHRYARLLDSMGRLPEAIAAEEKATELDPVSSYAWENLGYYYTEVGDYTRADAALDRALEIEPTSVYALTNLGTLRLLQGKGEEALNAFQKVDREGIRLTGIAMAEHTLAHARQSQQAQDESTAKHAKEDAYVIAEAFAWRGNKEQAFEWLKRAYNQRDGDFGLIKNDPLLKSLHSDPRFNTLLQKMNLPE